MVVLEVPDIGLRPQAEQAGVIGIGMQHGLAHIVAHRGQQLLRFDPGLGRGRLQP